MERNLSGHIIELLWLKANETKSRHIGRHQQASHGPFFRIFAINLYHEIIFRHLCESNKMLRRFLFKGGIMEFL
jgi:hypothetical protein